MNRVLVVFSDGLLSELDSARGLVSRSAWIRQAVEDKLMKEAVAPLVPDFFVCNCGHPETLHRKNGAFAPCQIALCECQQFSKPVPQLSVEGEPLNEYEMATGYRQEPKPKARRKKKGEPPKEYDFAKDRPEGCLCTYDMLGRIWNSACKVHDSASDRTQRYVETFLPSRCNRGACTGTINPVKGRCVRCNQTPLKESK